MNQCYWLASYPKSGNTWVRVFLGHLRASEVKTSALAMRERSPIAAHRGIMDEALGIDSSDLYFSEIFALRSEVDEYYAARPNAAKFRKIHDNYWVNGKPIISSAATSGAIYIVRNPLDVCISFSHHLGHGDIDKTIDFLNDPDFAFSSNPTRQDKQLPQYLSSWSQHVESWVGVPEIDVEVIRYEDLHADPIETFRRVAQFSQIEADESKIIEAIGLSSFNALQQDEIVNGFIERPASAKRFFREGKVGGWESILTQKQIYRVIDAHHETMNKFGYLDDL